MSARVNRPPHLTVAVVCRPNLVTDIRCNASIVEDLIHAEVS